MPTQPVTFDDYLKEQFNDPEFRKAWDALESEYRRKEEKLLKRIARAGHVVSKNDKAKEVRLEFHICLPKYSDVNGFANK